MFEWLTWEAFCALVVWLTNVGTNASVYSIIMNNALTIALIVIVTPWKWDDSVWKKIKDAISNFKNGGGRGETK